MYVIVLLILDLYGNNVYSRFEAILNSVCSILNSNTIFLIPKLRYFTD